MFPEQIAYLLVRIVDGLRIPDSIQHAATSSAGSIKNDSAKEYILNFSFSWRTNSIIIIYGTQSQVEPNSTVHNTL